MTSYVAVILFCYIMTVFLLFVSFFMMRADEEGFGIPAIVALFLCFIGGMMHYHYNETVVKLADKFFKTRSDAYSCELPDGYACKYRIKEWREDSVYWQIKVDKILKK